MPRRAFTLIELLVVIAIIGLLSSIAAVSLNTARAKARDARRQADIIQLSKAVEMFANDNGYLPRNAVNWCTYITNPTNGWGPAFQADIAPYMPNVPKDPLPAGATAPIYIYNNIDNKSRYSI